VKYELRAIETKFDGHLFRSRLEARWAVFFDALKIPYSYEREGYDLDGIWYLPDFWMPQQDCFIEIKPDKPTKIEERKASRLALASGKSVFVFSGDILVPDAYDSDSVTSAERYFAESDDRGDCECCTDAPYCWCECYQCGALGIRFEGRSDRLPCRQCYDCARGMPCGKCGEKCKRTGGNCDRGHSADSLRLTTAYILARMERFGVR